MDARDGLLTAKEVARIMRVHPATVRTWVHKGVLRGVQVPGGGMTIRIPVSALEELIAGQTDPTDALAQELAVWLAKHEEQFAPDLCPRCAVRGVDPKSAQGWCIGCTNEFLIAEDEKRERERARQLRWWHQNGNQWRADRKAKAKAAKLAAEAGEEARSA